MELILSVCLISDPTRCMDQRLPEIYEMENAGRCVAVSMPLAAQWAGEHPGWKIVKWRCDRAGSSDL